MAVEPLLGTNAQRAFIITVTIQAIVVVVMVGITFNFVENAVDLTAGQYKTIPCYLALFALAEIFELAMAFDALRLRNIIQLIGILIFQAALMILAALQVHQTRTAFVTRDDCSGPNPAYVGCDGPGTLWNKIQPLLIVVPCIIGVSWLLVLFWIRRLYAEFGWAIFHVVGANPKMKTMYQYYQIMVCLLKFDFFCFIGVTMELLIIVLSTDSVEFGLTIAAIPVVLVLLVLCLYAVQREIKWIMSISLVLMVAAMGYFVFKLVRFYSPKTQQQYITTRATLTTFTVVAFLVLFATFAVGLRCFSDFDRGLRHPKVNDVTTTTATSKFNTASPAGTPGINGMAQRSSSYMGGAALQPRISIE